MRLAVPAILLTLLAAGCGTFDGDVEIEIDSGFSNEDRFAIATAAAKWNTVTRRKIIVASRGDVLVISADNPTGYAGWESSRWDLVRIDPDAPREHVYSIALHEFGHMLGIRHTRSGVMHPSERHWELSEEDLAACRRAWAC